MLWMIAVVLAATLAAAGVLWVRHALAGDVQRASGGNAGSLFDLSTRTLAGEPVSLGIYRGKVALVVNTASKCGLTPQYAGLEALYRELAARGFVLLGFPSNDFLGQEPGSADEIAEFCSVNYDVTFPLFAKAVVKGDRKCDVYRLLCAELAEPSWNFTKYLVARDGRVVARFGPKTAPDSEELRAAIEQELAAP
ncbi:MAG TPA: glutathione peroxidase [Candidatus Krumholzibacteria bacterium]|nr:glutathione peroxidase [Candidatus Krumholzibacteria bacterium]HPD72626.1 glutathione peroxidase [Candidatus Krumholzibacteria bacterium]HRY40442.1 glutathione peroxidase [Candidatus Krumholzibacteria bacterium]